MKKENRAVNSLSPTSRRFLTMTAAVATSMSKMLFAAGDDLGITAYLDTIRSMKTGRQSESWQWEESSSSSHQPLSRQSSVHHSEMPEPDDDEVSGVPIIVQAALHGRRTPSLPVCRNHHRGDPHRFEALHPHTAGDPSPCHCGEVLQEGSVFSGHPDGCGRAQGEDFRAKEEIR